MIDEDWLIESVWETAYEDWKYDICQEISQQDKPEGMTEDDYQRMIEEAVEFIVDVDTYCDYFNDEITDAVEEMDDCLEYLQDVGINDAINEYLNDCYGGCTCWDLDFDIQDCAKETLRKNLEYDYDDFVSDIVEAIVESTEDIDVDDYSKRYQNAVERITDDFNEE